MRHKGGGSNPFSCLADDDAGEGASTNKKPKTSTIQKKHESNNTILNFNNSTEEFPRISNHPSKTESEHKYLNCKASENSKKMTDYSTIIIDKGLQGISKKFEVKSITRDGILLIKVPNKYTATLFLKATQIANIPVQFTINTKLSSSKGTIYTKYLENEKDEEILRNPQAKNESILDIYRFREQHNKQNQNKTKYTGRIIITIDSQEPPKTVKIGFLQLEVRKYYDNPMKCRKCLKLNHTTKHCTSQYAWCTYCAMPITSTIEDHSNNLQATKMQAMFR